MVIRDVRRVSLWDKQSISPLLTGIHIAPGSAEYEELGKQMTSSPNRDFCAIGLPMFTPSQPVISGEMQCSHCKATFTTREEQIEHYRLDWHRYNLQRSLANKAPLTEEQFGNNLSDVSSVSGSDDDNSEGEEDQKDGQEEELSGQVLGRQARMFFINTDGLVISIFRGVLFSKKSQMEGEDDAVNRVQYIAAKQLWAVILLGGGHFAAAVFSGNDVVVHKTFHNYTVRAKQGGGQSAKDNQSGTSHPKSGGSSLRRFNEMSQRQHIQELMESWKPHLAQCKLIFFHAKHHNRTTLFSGKNAILSNQDPRLRTIPFPTKRAKFSEVKRVYGLLSEIYVHGTEEEFQSMIKEATEKEKQPIIKKKKKEPATTKKAGRKPKSERRGDSSPVNFSSSEESAEDSEDEIVMMTSLVTLGTEGLGGLEDECSFDINKKRSKMNRGNRTTPRKSPNKKGRNQSEVYNELFTACRTGDLNTLMVILQKPPEPCTEDGEESKDTSDSPKKEKLPQDLSQITFGAQQKTMLHVSSENNHKDVIWWLMDNGCDPSKADRQGLYPYSASKNKDTRNHFRRFRAQYPVKYDYQRANVPSPLTPEEDEEQAAIRAKQKKAKRKAQQENQKKKQKEINDKIKEADEKRRFLGLSDREKRALAAERRLVQQQEESGAATQVLRRCFDCGIDITGMVPFEYSDNKFCSTKCVREHRTKSAKV